LALSSESPGNFNRYPNSNVDVDAAVEVEVDVEGVVEVVDVEVADLKAG
jgi:hypothetical protein